MNKKAMYAINLVDYWDPQDSSIRSGYVGTLQDLASFAEELEKIEHPDSNITETITTIRSQLNNESPGCISDNLQDPTNAVYTLKFIHQYETVTLEDHYWQYRTINDAVYPMYADRITLDRIMVSLDGILYTAVKSTMQGLHVCLQGFGWTGLHGVMNGFPETFTYDHSEDRYESRLYIIDYWIFPEEKEKLIQNWDLKTDWNLACLCRNIIGDGNVEKLRSVSPAPFVLYDSRPLCDGE